MFSETIHCFPSLYVTETQLSLRIWFSGGCVDLGGQAGAFLGLGPADGDCADFMVGGRCFYVLN